MALRHRSHFLTGRAISTMSIHANLSPKEQEHLNAQKWNSTISSAVIAILKIVVIAQLLALKSRPYILASGPDIQAICQKSVRISIPPEAFDCCGSHPQLFGFVMEK